MVFIYKYFKIDWNFILKYKGYRTKEALINPFKYLSLPRYLDLSKLPSFLYNLYVFSKLLGEVLSDPNYFSYGCKL